MIYCVEDDNGSRNMMVYTLNAAGLKADITAPTPEAPSIAKALTLYMQQENK